jgi:hypothetical protein
VNGEKGIWLRWVRLGFIYETVPEETKMKIKHLLLPAALIALVAAFTTSDRLPTASAADKNAKEMALRDAMDKLWEDHIMYTRLFIVDAAADLPEKDAHVARLLQNQVDIGNASKPYYGDAAGDQLTTLLKEHITTAADVVTAAKMNNQKTLDAANKAWFDNADRIAAFLGKANPKNWPEADMRNMMHDHLNLTTKEAVAQLHKDWNGSIAAYDDVHTQILHMADGLSQGIVNQFPEKFK